jgi:hypothetical protein
MKKNCNDGNKSEKPVVLPDLLAFRLSKAIEELRRAGFKKLKCVFTYAPVTCDIEINLDETRKIDAYLNYRILKTRINGGVVEILLCCPMENEKV